MFSVAGGVAEHVKSGRLKAIAVSTSQPMPLVPGLPTVAASGVPGFSAVSTAGMFAPANTPPAIINWLNREFVRAINGAQLKGKLFKMGVEAVTCSPEEFAAFIKSDMAKMSKVIEKAGIRGP